MEPFICIGILLDGNHGGMEVESYCLITVMDDVIFKLFAAFTSKYFTRTILVFSLKF